MKKERPAPTLSALVGAPKAETVRQAIFTQTTTLGVWENWVAKVAKRALDREALTVAVDGRPVRVKVGRLPDGTVVTA